MLPFWMADVCKTRFVKFSIIRCVAGFESSCEWNVIECNDINCVVHEPLSRIFLHWLHHSSFMLWFWWHKRFITPRTAMWIAQMRSLQCHSVNVTFDRDSVTLCTKDCLWAILPLCVCVCVYVNGHGTNGNDVFTARESCSTRKWCTNRAKQKKNT